MDESVIDDLQRQLSTKEDLLTETRLEALSSASQMQALREQVAKLRSELRNVKKENEDLKTKLRSTTPVKNHVVSSFSAFELKVEMRYNSHLGPYINQVDRFLTPFAFPLCGHFY